MNDTELRALERAAATGTREDRFRLWAAQRRAGARTMHSDLKDWTAIFHCAVGVPPDESSWVSSKGTGPTAAVPGSKVSLEPFTRADVVEIVASYEGAPDEEDWLMVVRLADGRYASLRAGCDYSGWG